MLHDVSQGRLVSYVINTASDRDVRQTIDVVLDLPGFEVAQKTMSLQRLELRLQDMVGAAILEAGR
ncbi:MAG: hypothetical protein ABW063_11830 [Caulobacter sp.]